MIVWLQLHEFDVFSPIVHFMDPSSKLCNKIEGRTLHYTADGCIVPCVASRDLINLVDTCSVSTNMVDVSMNCVQCIFPKQLA